jgi:hypothetical protein
VNLSGFSVTRGFQQANRGNKKTGAMVYMGRANRKSSGGKKQAIRISNRGFKV